MSFREFYESENPAILVHNTDAEFAFNIINGKKTIETRGVKLPERLKDVPLELVTNIGKKRFSLGKVTFSDSFMYDPEQDMERWEGDRERHMVPTDSTFNLSDKKRFGWVVSNVEKYPEPIPFDSKFLMTGLKYPT